MRDATFRAFDRKGLRPQVRMELGSNEAIKHAVVGGLGLSVMSLHTLVLEGINGPVAVLDVEGFPLMRKWYMVYPKSKELSLVSRTFLDFAVEYESIICDRMESLLPSIKNSYQESKEHRLEKNPIQKQKRNRFRFINLLTLNYSFHNKNLWLYDAKYIHTSYFKIFFYIRYLLI